MLGTEFPDPTPDRRPVDDDTTFGEEVSGVLIRKRVAQMHADRTSDSDGGDSVTLKGWRDDIGNLILSQDQSSDRLVQQSPLSRCNF